MHALCTRLWLTILLDVNEQATFDRGWRVVGLRNIANRSGRFETANASAFSKGRDCPVRPPREGGPGETTGLRPWRGVEMVDLMRRGHLDHGERRTRRSAAASSTFNSLARQLAALLRPVLASSEALDVSIGIERSAAAGLR